MNEVLDNEIEEKFYKNDLENMYLSIPNIIDYDNFSGFTYKLGINKIRRFELDLVQCLNDKKKNFKDIDINYLHRNKIYVLDGNEQEIDSWSIYDTLNVEIYLNDTNYILNEGNWYEIDEGYAIDVNKFFDKYKNACNLKLPNYEGKTEPQYLVDITKHDDNLILMDRKFIKPPNASSKIEFSDLIKKDDHRIIHVKKYSSSSVMSHLFSQALVSSEVLLEYNNISDEINKLISSEYNYKFEFTHDDFPRKIITLAIMQKTKGDLHLRFFSKINFRKYCKSIENMGYKVEILKIPF